MAKILIIEDDKRISNNVSKGLREKGYETEIAYDGLIGLKLALSHEYDLILLDINLPSMNGYEVCRKIREHRTSVPILMLTALGELDDKMEGFETGADDYIVKPFDFRELLARIRVFLKRASGTENDANVRILKAANLEINLENKEVRRNNKLIELTPKEFALLEYLFRNKGRIISKIEIAEHVWDINFETSTNVIEVYINFLRKKIDRDFEPKLIHTKSGMGYIFREE